MSVADNISIFADQTINISGKLHELQLAFISCKCSDAFAVCLTSTAHTKQG